MQQSDYKLPIWYHAINMTMLVLAATVLLAYTITPRFFRDDYPYDYGILMFGGELFCYQPEQFSYGGEYLYPAPFYTTFCGLFHHLPEPLYFVWMLAPFVLVVILAGQRAAAMVYPPLFIHMQLGQSTSLLLPLYWLADIASRHGVRWWYGLFVPLAIFKPHIAILPVVFLFWFGRKQVLFWLSAIVSSIIVMLPAFILQPSWVVDWLSAGRGFKLPSIANVGIIPIQILQLGEEQTPLINATVGQLIVLAWGGLIALGLLWWIHHRRGELTFYDWVLVFAFTNPFMHDYDLIILLPLIANRPRRLLLAITAGALVWVYAFTFTSYFNASVVIPLVLIAARLLRLDDEFDPIAPPARWG